jgi:magnesium transporter
MLTAFSFENNRLVQHAVYDRSELTEAVLWVDLIRPTQEEQDLIQEAYGQVLPTPDELSEIEASARCYEDEDGLHIHAYFLHDIDEDRPKTITVAFTLNKGRLFTFHEEELLPFRVFRMRARRQPGYATDALSILLGLFETNVERLADILEEMHAALESANASVFETNEKDLRDFLGELTHVEDLNGKVRLSMMDGQRVLSYLLRHTVLSSMQELQLREILADIKSLLTHSSFLFEKVRFLLEATMGIINVEQNKIVKIFTVMALVFMPPTLIASIYGMNFQWIPELHWKFGYFYSLGLMVTSVALAFWFFRKKGWL